MACAPFTIALSARVGAPSWPSATTTIPLVRSRAQADTPSVPLRVCLSPIACATIANANPLAPSPTPAWGFSR